MTKLASLVFVAGVVSGDLSKVGAAEPEKTISATLSISVTESVVTARLTYENHSKEKVYLDRIQAGLGDYIGNKIFEIKSGTRVVEYNGPLVTRQGSLLEVFTELMPGQSLTTEMRLDKSYRFFNGSREYVAVYSAYHGYPGRPLLFLRSNTVKFVVKK